MLKNIFIIVSMSLVIPNMCFAAADNGVGKLVLDMVIIMFAIGVIGIVSSIAATAFGDGRIGNVIKNGAFLGCVAVFVAIAGVVMDGTVGMIYKVMKLVS